MNYNVVRKQVSKKAATKEEVRALFRQALKEAFNETQISPRDFTWFSNKPVHHN